MDKRLLDILCCPTTRIPVHPLDRSGMDALNRAIASGSVRTAGGAAVVDPWAAALITRDGQLIYRVEDDIPVMLADEAIAVAQLGDFPRV